LQRLSTPLVPVSDDVLAVPLVGSFDQARGGRLMEQLLPALGQRAVRTAIIDVTGVPKVDTEAAAALVSVSQAARLLGTRVVLTGLRPDVAQALVGLDVDLRGLVTLRDLQSGIAYAMRQR
jgi:rsbT co-antagonist protein RsbR